MKKLALMALTLVAFGSIGCTARFTYREEYVHRIAPHPHGVIIPSSACPPAPPAVIMQPTIEPPLLFPMPNPAPKQ